MRMGAWDVSVFGNDDAADFLYEFDDAHTVSEVAPILQGALDSVLGARGEIDAPDGAVGLAAAALVVAWAEPALLEGEVDEDFSPWPRTADPLPGQLPAKAAQVLDRLREPRGNELSELWAEADELSEFQAEITRWRSRLP
jgi:hypothetical protein